MEINDKELFEPESIEEIKETQDDEGVDTTDWKSLALKNQGIARRYDTKLKKIREVKEAEDNAKAELKAKADLEKNKSQDKKDFDLTEKAYLLANGIKKSQIPLVWQEVESSGKSIDEILESPYFKEKLEMEASKEAIPSDSKRGGGAAHDSVDYWITKGEYPPNTLENTELRRKVAQALASKAVNKQKFSPRPVA